MIYRFRDSHPGNDLPRLLFSIILPASFAFINPFKFFVDDPLV